MKRTVPEPDTVAMARMKFEMENRTKRGMVSNFWGLFRSRPDMSQAAKSGTPPMEGYRPTIPLSVPPAAATPGALGTNEVSISNPGSDSEIDKGKEVRANPTGAEPAPPAAAAPAVVPTPENAAKAADPNAAVKQASMTPAQQKKEYQKQLKQQQDAVKKAQGDRKKKEAELQQKVKEQKKKSKAKQDAQKQEEKPPQPPAPAGGQAPTPPAKL
jgi:chemotaxis protein histidine kinase CheA